VIHDNHGHIFRIASELNGDIKYRKIFLPSTPRPKGSDWISWIFVSK